MTVHSLPEAVLDGIGSGCPLVLVTMMDQSGSVPRTAGARMLVKPDGRIWGTVGGGRYEAEAISLARQLLREFATSVACADAREESRGAILEYSLRGVTDMDMICGGTLSLLLEVVHADARSRELYTAALEAEKKLMPFVFISRFQRRDGEAPVEEGNRREDEVPVEAGAACAATVLRYLSLPGEQKIVPEAPDLPESIPARAALLNDGTPHHIVQDGRDYLLELFERPFRIIIFGCGHVSFELAKIVRSVDFPLAAIDDRTEFANLERFPGSEVLVPEGLSENHAAACLRALRAGPRDGIVIVTRGHAHDRDVLAAALQTDAGYIGMIGSRSKREAVYRSMMDKGFSRERIGFVHSPIGLSIGAETPQEIAVSIAAELIQWRKNARDAVKNEARPAVLCQSMGCERQ